MDTNTNGMASGQRPAVANGGGWWPVVANIGPSGPSCVHAWCLPGHYNSLHGLLPFSQNYELIDCQWQTANVAFVASVANVACVVQYGY